MKINTAIVTETNVTGNDSSENTELVSREVKEVVTTALVTTEIVANTLTGENIEKVHTVEDKVVTVKSVEHGTRGRPLSTTSKASLDEVLLGIYKSETKSTTRVALGPTLYAKLMGDELIMKASDVPGYVPEKQTGRGRPVEHLILTKAGRSRASVLNMQKAAAAKRLAKKASAVGEFIESMVPTSETVNDEAKENVEAA